MIYYVIAAGLSGTQFEFSTTPGGTAVNTTGTQSGTQTVVDAGFMDLTSFGLAYNDFEIDFEYLVPTVGSGTD